MPSVGNKKTYFLIVEQLENCPPTAIHSKIDTMTTKSHNLLLSIKTWDYLNFQGMSKGQTLS